MNNPTNENVKGENFQGELENFEFFEEKKNIESNLDNVVPIEIDKDDSKTEIENKTEEKKNEDLETKIEVKENNVFNFDEIKFENKDDFNFANNDDNVLTK